MRLQRTLFPCILAAGLMISSQAKAHFLVDINEKVVTPGVFLCIDGKVATLRGTVDNRLDKALLERSAARLEGIEEVRNYLRVGG